MNEQRHSPAAAIKKILGSGKITFICIMFTIAALAAFGDVMDNHLDFDEFEVFGQEVDLGKLIGYEGVELLNMISDAIFILGIIGMLPKLLVAIAFWMIRSGSGEGEKCNKNAILGFNFFKINFMYKAVIQMLGLTVIGLVGIIIIIGTLSGSVDATVILIEVVALALVIGYFYFFFKYNTNYVAMLSGVTMTLRTNVNVVVKSNQVIVFNYIVAIYLIISSFGNGIWGLVAGVLDALSIIFVNRCFAEFDNIFGYATPEKSKAVIERLRTDPSLEKTAIALGVGREYASDPMDQKPPVMKFFKNMMFGLSVAYIDDVGASATVKTAAKPSTASSAGNEGSAVNAAKVTPATVRYDRAPDSNEELTAKLLPLFSEASEISDKRYSTVGKRSFFRTSYPVELRSAEVAVDSLSEKKILRLIFENASPERVSRIKLTLIPKSNEGSAIGVMKNVTYECDADKGDRFGGTYGLILPDNATCGTVRVTYVEFADGLYRDKAGEESYFSTDEKTEFDTKLYLSVMSR